MYKIIEDYSWKLVVFVIYVFLFFPLLVIFVMSFNESGISFPPTGFTLEWYVSMLGDSRLRSAFLLSIFIGLFTTILTVPLVVLAGISLRDEQLPANRLIESFFLFPLIVPQVIVGFALLVYFTSYGLAGTWIGITLAHIVITVPYALQTILAALKSMNQDVEEAARNLGAGRLETLWYVTIPMIKPAILAGAGYVFVLSFTNFTVSIFLIGSSTVTIPVEIYQYITFRIDATITAIGAVLTLFSLSMVLFIERVFGVQKMSGF
jgi:putative spermidine/putrescine transport system permease protein